MYRNVAVDLMTELSSACHTLNYRAPVSAYASAVAVYIVALMLSENMHRTVSYNADILIACAYSTYERTAMI